MQTTLTRADVLAILGAFPLFINQKPDLDPANYGCHPKQLAYSSQQERQHARHAMRTEARAISEQGTRARKALRVAVTYEPNPEAMAEALTAFSGRLSWIKSGDGAGEFEYTTGQYYPTEYRAAAAVVLERYNEVCRKKTLPPAGFDPRTVEDMERANHQAGGHWFSTDNKRFFRSRILPTIYKGPGGIFFVSSEKGPSERRLFSVRQFDPATADVHSHGPFNKWTRAAAQGIAREAADGRHQVCATCRKCKECEPEAACWSSEPGHKYEAKPAA